MLFIQNLDIIEFVLFLN